MASARKRGQRWTALYRNSDGRQKSAGTYDTEEEALARAKVAELDANPPGPELLTRSQVRGKVTVAAYAPRWLDDQLLEPTSMETYRRTADRIVRHLGGKPKDDVSPDDVRRMLKGLEKSGLSDATIAATLDLARSMLGEQACAGVRYRVRDRREMLVATREQARAIEDAMSPRYKLLVRTAFTTGCRWGELIALRGTDVQKRSNGYVLKIRRTVIEVAGERSERPYGKSARATRDITIPEALALDLMAFGPELCFTNAVGGYLRRNAFRKGFWLPAIRKARMPGLRVHDMRHSAISWWCSAGIPLPRVMYRAGHANISTTSRYVHPLPADDDPFLGLAA